MGPSSRTSFILSGIAVIILFVGALLGLTFGLASPPLEDGGSPPGPPGIGNPPRSPGIGNPPGPLGIGNPPRSPGIGNLPGPPGIRNPLGPLGIGNPSRSPGIGNPPRSPGIGNPPRSPGIGNPPRSPGIRNPPRSPGIGNPPDPPGIGNPPGSLGIGNPPRSPGIGNPSTGTDEVTYWIPTDSSDNHPPFSEFGQYRFAAVASDSGVCSQIGTDILGRLGGTAVDAAIASMLCVGVVCAHSTGIGGGHFMTIYDTPRGEDEKILTTIISREKAPGFAHRDMFVNNTDASVKGGLSIAVPGEISGFYMAWERFGRVDWAELVLPTERLLRDGFPVERSLASAIRSYESDIRDDPNLSEVFVKEDGSLMQEGDIFTDPKLADTFERIALDPTDYYLGSLAQDIVADIAEYGGNITLEDLQNYYSKEKDPLNVTLSNGDYTLYTTRPPSSGAVFQFILNIMDAFDLSGADKLNDDGEGLMYHRLAESFKFAYAKRSSLGDEDYWDVEELVRNLTSDDYASYIRSRIDDHTTHDVDYYEPDFELEEDSGTSHLSVLAPGGSAVALTSTINLFFGSNVRGSRTGIIFNDEMDDFSTPGTSNNAGVPASPSNFIVPGKMPMSSMCPAIVMNNKNQPVLIIGAAGGTRITTVTSFVSAQNLWMKERIDLAVDSARLHHQLVPNWVSHESFLDEGIIESLVSRNHETVPTSSMAALQAIHNLCAECEQDCEELCVHAACDGRKGGAPDGF